MGKSTHGDSKTRLHSIWRGMKYRTTNPNINTYFRYGAKGIKVCDEWSNSYESFKEWSLANGYNDNLSIDRIDSRGDYSPSNCRWCDRATQSQNVGLSSKNTSGYKGVYYSKKDKLWIARISINKKRISIGYFKDKVLAAKQYDNYIIDNNLNHTTNKKLGLL